MIQANTRYQSRTPLGIAYLMNHTKSKKYMSQRTGMRSDTSLRLTRLLHIIFREPLTWLSYGCPVLNRLQTPQSAHREHVPLRFLPVKLLFTEHGPPNIIQSLPQGKLSLQGLAPVRSNRVTITITSTFLHLASPIRYQPSIKTQTMPELRENWDS